MEFVFKMSDVEAKTMFSALGGMPYRDVAQMIQNLAAQLQAQTQPQPTPPVAQPPTQ